MSQTDSTQQLETLNNKLNRALRRVAALREKAKILEMQYNDAREREGNTNELVRELLERQRELNVMLNRANIMLNRTQEAMALTSLEFNEMVKALPEPKKAEWTDRVARVNELFKQTGVQDAELGALDGGAESPEQSLNTDEFKRESEEAFGRKRAIWDLKEKHDPPRVHAEVVEEESRSESTSDPIRLIGEDSPSADSAPVAAAAGLKQCARTFDPRQSDEQQPQEEPPRRKSWWRRLA